MDKENRRICRVMSIGDRRNYRGQWNGTVCIKRQNTVLINSTNVQLGPSVKLGRCSECFRVFWMLWNALECSECLPSLTDGVPHVPQHSTSLESCGTPPQLTDAFYTAFHTMTPLFNIACMQWLTLAYPCPLHFPHNSHAISILWHCTTT